MMIDIVYRLRNFRRGEAPQIMFEAADEIESQFDKVTKYEAALRNIANKCPATCDMTLAHEMAQEAEDALRGE